MSGILILWRVEMETPPPSSASSELLPAAAPSTRPPGWNKSSCSSRLWFLGLLWPAAAVPWVTSVVGDCAVWGFVPRKRRWIGVGAPWGPDVARLEILLPLVLSRAKYRQRSTIKCCITWVIIRLDYWREASPWPIWRSGLSEYWWTIWIS